MNILLLYVRSFLFFLIFSVLTITLSILIILLIPLNYKLRYKLSLFWNHITLYLLKLICNLNYQVKGIENIPNFPVIIQAKHQSAWETIALPVILPMYLSWVIKYELIFVPIFGWAIYSFKPIAINRKSGIKSIDQIINQGTNNLQNGKSIIIFPEGTRVAPGIIGRYGSGGSILAKKSNTPILPIALNAGHFWKRRGFIKYPGTISVSIGKLIYPDDKNVSDIKNEVKDWIESEMTKIK